MNQEEKSRRSREQIILCALQEFSVSGYEYASLNKVCKNHHISKGRIYHHFENKDDLYLACIAFSYDKMIEHSIIQTEQDGASLEMQFHSLFSARQQFMVNNPYIPSLLWSSLNTPPAHLIKEILAEQQKFVKHLTNLLGMIFSPFPWYNENMLPTFVEMFIIASNRVHGINMRVWSPDKPKEELSEIAAGSISLFDNLIKIFLYGVLPRK